ncbi:hypothetical protein HYPSUDRAFT_206555 [Hypholoma sublateritium FD-334 SS-4]|uniref:Uncharacterized protein n=1 Tax=Hypholoma sublateritium (strain FD-334 SS-4) TaxID=945553 RepID=A0A0D2KQT6_HYPSF|nr:hypothetical protein HYPSUDRAFT_206555 [Hypholoma sublateritium FD-334 SS-4]
MFYSASHCGSLHPISFDNPIVPEKMQCSNVHPPVCTACLVWVCIVLPSPCAASTSGSASRDVSLTHMPPLPSPIQSRSTSAPIHSVPAQPAYPIPQNVDPPVPMYALCPPPRHAVSPTCTAYRSPCTTWTNVASLPFMHGSAPIRRAAWSSP